MVESVAATAAVVLSRTNELEHERPPMLCWSLKRPLMSHWRRGLKRALGVGFLLMTGIVRVIS